MVGAWREVVRCVIQRSISASSSPLKSKEDLIGDVAQGTAVETLNYMKLNYTNLIVVVKSNTCAWLTHGVTL